MSCFSSFFSREKRTWMPFAFSPLRLLIGICLDTRFLMLMKFLICGYFDWPDDLLFSPYTVFCALQSNASPLVFYLMMDFTHFPFEILTWIWKAEYFGSTLTIEWLCWDHTKQVYVLSYSFWVCQRYFSGPTEYLGSSAIQFALHFPFPGSLIFQRCAHLMKFCCLVCGAIDFLELKYFE